MNTDRVRVRFAPSPTGPLHMGGVRTALYNYLFAKKHGGDFLLRIEDTDQTRYVPGAEDYIKEALEWCGLTPDESPWKPGECGPYRQSERKGLYRKYADQLIESGHAYYAFDSEDELNEMREQAKAAKMPNWQYNSITRSSMKNSVSLSEDDTKARLEAGDPYVIRLKVPRNEEIRFHDEIRGWVVVNSSNVDDKVIYKSDGMPTYHLANIVDDHLMEITHVIRGEEWLPSAPLHIMLYQFLGWNAPKFAHLPLILKPDGHGKLSKRDGDRLGFPVFPIDWIDPSTGEKSSGYREQGYFREAFINMLVMLGWNPGTSQEMFTLAEMTEAFTLERVGKAGAKFDANKTKWYNQQYLREKSNEELAELTIPFLQEAGYSYDASSLPVICDMMKERAHFIKEIVEDGEFFFKRPESYDEKTVSKKWKEDTAALVRGAQDALNATTPYEAEPLHNAFKSYLESNELGFGKVAPGLRVAITGKGMGPDLFQTCQILGKDEVNARIDEAIEKLG